LGLKKMIRLGNVLFCREGSQIRHNLIEPASDQM
jgi:hypothetical protein